MTLRRETWEFRESTAKQQYATHSFFRYFGKLPPVVTRRILQESADYLAHGPVVDVACGSGTTLVEATLLDLPSSGVDVNPLSVLATRVKTRPIAADRLATVWRSFAERVEDLLPRTRRSGLPQHLAALLPDVGRLDYWFTSSVQKELAALRHAVQAVEDEACRDLFMLALAGVVRRSSNASERAGRIFLEVGKIPPSPWALMQQRVERMRAGLIEFAAQANGHRPDVRLADARETGLLAASCGLVFFHPPYFALYKYSSDVLRFELEWLGFDRKKTARMELRDGFKTTKAEDVQPYLEDLRAVFVEARRIVHPRGALVVISNNSTLRKRELPIIPGILRDAASAGFRPVRHAVRSVRYAQASYHRSADAAIRTPRDHILFFEPAKLRRTP